MENNFNPEIKVLKVGDLNVIQEHALVTGTKQRGINFFRKMVKEEYDEVVGISSVYGYGQVAVSFCCKMVNVKCTLFVSHLRNLTPLSKKAIAFGGNLIEVETWKNRELKEEAEKYVQSQIDKGLKVKFLPLGLDDEDFMEYLYQALVKVTGHIKPSRMWLAVGSGVIIRVLVRIWPNCEFLAVQVGRDIPDYLLEGIKYTKYVYPASFSQNTLTPPPYESLANYDAKIWYFAKKYGQKGDFIWNVK